jgi:hypothetical protein
MAHTQDEPSHVVAVDTWLARSITHCSSAEVVGLFRVAFEALWNRAVTTLGSVTLTAIAECVLITATNQYEFLSVIKPHAPHASGASRGKQQVYERLTSVPRSELVEGLRFGLIELLTVIGRLTAELLSQELHDALHATTPDLPEPSAPEPTPVTSRRISLAGEPNPVLIALATKASP